MRERKDRFEEPPVVNLEGTRVALGPLRHDLLATYQRWFNDFAMLASLDRFMHPTTAAQVAAWFERRTGPQRDPSYAIFTVYERATWRPIGNAALQDVNHRNRTAEFGIFLGEPDSRGKGLGTEATRLMLDFAFGALGLHSVMLRVYAYNLAALRLYERVGFREFGRRRQCQWMGDRLWDVVYMECLAEEWEGSMPNNPFAVVPGGDTNLSTIPG